MGNESSSYSNNTCDCDCDKNAPEVTYIYDKNFNIIGKFEGKTCQHGSINQMNHIHKIIELTEEEKKTGIMNDKDQPTINWDQLRRSENNN